MSGPFQRFLMLHAVPPLGLALIRALGRSWRFRETRPEILEQGLADDRPLVGAFLHGRLFQVLYYMSRRRGAGRWLAMCSKSLDGEAMTRIEEALGYRVVRGSSGSGGFEALVEMIRAVRKDPTLSSCLAVDGSRGPRDVVQTGIVSLAQRTGGRILPVAASAHPAVVFRRSWDRTALPLPFARVHVVYGELIDVPAKPTREQVEEIRSRLEATMHALQAEADERSGFRDPSSPG